MNHTVNFSVRTAVAAAVLSLGSAAFAAPAFDANIELDNTYRSGSAVAEADKGLGQGGRVEMNATGKAGANMFVAGKAAFLAKKDGTVAADDMWIQVGSAGGDVKLGRFEAADLFPLAQDTLINHAGNVYGTNTLRGRKDGSQFHAAGTLNLSAGLSLELGVVENKTTAKGVRPVLSYAAGPLTARLGFEAGKYAAVGGAAANDVRGVGATVGYDFGGFKLTGNLASGKTDAATRNNQSAFALTAAVGGLVVGVISGKTEAAVGDDKVQTVYASYNLPLFDIKGASITPALSSSTGKTAAGVETTENSLRVRLNYAF
ncbi:MAG: carbohydrate porin [Rhodoferax sp.]|nr:carbohydrate porin [Rhodoferax sp.]